MGNSNLVVVEGYQITEYLKNRWFDLKPLIYDTLTDGWKGGMDAHLTLQTATNQQLARLVSAYVLGFIDPSTPYGTLLFNEFNRLRPTLAIETPCVEWDEELNQWMVWLRLRSSDEAYKNEYEVGGSGWNGHPETFEDVATRTFGKKFGVPVTLQTILWPSSFPNQEERGSYFHLVCPVKFDIRPEVKGVDIIRVPVNQLPENTVEHHREIIIPAAAAYAKNRALYEAGLFMQQLALGQKHLGENGQAFDQETAKLVVAAALKLKQPQTPMGTDMYNAFAPHATNISCEGVCLRQAGDGHVEVFLTEHPFYPGKLVGMGQVVRAGEDYTDTLDRLREKEFGVPTVFKYVGERHYPKGERGHFLCRIYLSSCEGEPKTKGGWYRAFSLPENVESGHAEMINHALVVYTTSLNAPW